MAEDERTRALATKRIIAGFNDAARCRHGSVRAYCCVQRDQSGWKTFNPGGPLEAVTASGKTVGHVIDEFVADGFASRAELETYVRGRVRWRKIKNLSAAGGLAIVGITAVVVGGKLVLRLLPAKPQTTGRGGK